MSIKSLIDSKNYEILQTKSYIELTQFLKFHTTPLMYAILKTDTIAFKIIFDKIPDKILYTQFKQKNKTGNTIWEILLINLKIAIKYRDNTQDLHQRGYQLSYCDFYQNFYQGFIEIMFDKLKKSVIKNSLLTTLNSLSEHSNEILYQKFINLLNKYRFKINDEKDINCILNSVCKNTYEKSYVMLEIFLKYISDTDTIKINGILTKDEINPFLNVILNQNINSNLMIDLLIYYFDRNDEDFLLKTLNIITELDTKSQIKYKIGGYDIIKRNKKLLEIILVALNIY